MKKLVLALAAAATVGTALPAAAQPWHRPMYTGSAIARRDANLTHRVIRAEQNGRIAPRIAIRLRGELNRIRFLAHRWGRDGLNGREVANLNMRLDHVQMQLQRARV